MQKFRGACVALTSVSLISLGLQTPAAAGIVGTSEAISITRSADPRATIDAALARDDVRAKLAELGVDAREIEGRLAALSEAELAALADEIEQAPAGGSALAVIGIVFVVLVILEFVGVIDVFKKA
jgi:hypothetical protein